MNVEPDPKVDFGKKPYDRATHTAAEEPDKAWEQYFDQTYGSEVQGVEKRIKPPIFSDPAPFSRWLITQVHRRDRVGAVARVAAQDVGWPGGESRRDLVTYFQRMRARSYVMAALANAWEDFDKVQKREANKGKRQQQKQARKANRAKRPKKR